MQGGVTYRNEPCHPECFTCTNCQKALTGQRFKSRDQTPYCVNCYGELFCKRCTLCCKPITGTLKFNIECHFISLFLAIFLKYRELFLDNLILLT